jgi:glycosyltransferase involved in cell wall biosynthesis
MSYRLLLFSPITLSEKDGSFYAFDLWARELAKQADVAELCLVSPVKQFETGKQIVQQIDPRIRVQPYEQLDKISLDALVDAADVVQVPGTSGWRDSRASRRLLKAARRAGKLAILSVSSNRARTSWLNSSGRGLARRIKGFIDYVDIRLSQSWLALHADGITAVGNGVARLFQPLHANVLVCTASWIRTNDIAAPTRRVECTPIQICMASRIEWMKGTHIGVSAIKSLLEQDQVDLRLTIIGEGPQKSNLQRLVAEADLSAITSFLEPIAYPRPFLDLLGSMDLLLLTNLNDEQPRVLFDAISQGCIPICPDTPTYREFGIDQRLFYEQGNASDLARAIRGLCETKTRETVRAKLIEIARKFTIDAMYKARSAWIESMLLSRGFTRQINTD